MAENIAKRINDRIDAAVDAAINRYFGDPDGRDDIEDNGHTMPRNVQRSRPAARVTKPETNGRTRTAVPDSARSKPGPKKGTRYAFVAYRVRRPKGEPKRPADLPVWKFLLRHKAPQSQLDVEKGTGLSQKVVQNCLYRLRAVDKLIDRIDLDQE